MAARRCCSKRSLLLVRCRDARGDLPHPRRGRHVSLRCSESDVTRSCAPNLPPGQSPQGRRFPRRRTSSPIFGVAIDGVQPQASNKDACSFVSLENRTSPRKRSAEPMPTKTWLAPWWKPTWNPHNRVFDNVPAFGTARKLSGDLTTVPILKNELHRPQTPNTLQSRTSTKHTKKSHTDHTTNTQRHCHAQFSADLNMPNATQTTVRHTRTERHCARTSSPLN